VLGFERPNGWSIITNFGAEPYELDRTDAVISSIDAASGVVPAESTVWFSAR